MKEIEIEMALVFVVAYMQLTNDVGYLSLILLKMFVKLQIFRFFMSRKFDVYFGEKMTFAICSKDRFR